MTKDYSDRPSLEEELLQHTDLTRQYNTAAEQLPSKEVIARMSARKLRQLRRSLDNLTQLETKIKTLEEQVQTREKDLHSASRTASIAWGGLMLGFVTQLYFHSSENKDSAAYSLLHTAATYIRSAAMVYGAYAITVGTAKRALALSQKTFLQHGLYALHRHPIYFAFRSAAVGMFLENPTVVQGVTSSAVVLASEYVARKEEEALGIRHGKSYAEYLAKVNRWIPSFRSTQTRII